MSAVPRGSGGTVAPGDSTEELGAFEHQAFLYDGMSAFVEGTVPFIHAGLEADEPVLVVVDDDKIGRLREELGRDAGRVSFADMAEVGRNPARIIPAWLDFLAAHQGRPAPRGIGEPVWPGRSADELAECQRHEALLNVAFAPGVPWRLLCPYDASTLPAEVLDEARHSHRFVSSGAAFDKSIDYQGDDWTGEWSLDLPEPPCRPEELAFGSAGLDAVRRFVVAQARHLLDPPEVVDLLQAVTEIAGNSVVHGGGSGTLRTWPTTTGVVCEVRDRGWIRAPLAGRIRPPFDSEGGRGLWIANQLADLVQVRSSPAGTVVRIHMHRRSPPRADGDG